MAFGLFPGGIFAGGIPMTFFRMFFGFGQVSPGYAKYGPGGAYEQEHGTIDEQKAVEAKRRAENPFWYIEDWLNAYKLQIEKAMPKLGFLSEMIEEDERRRR